MKKLFLSVALLGLAVSCKSTTTDVTDTSAPAPDCAVECATECDDAAKECDAAAKAECTEATVCPVTGKAIN